MENSNYRNAKRRQNDILNAVIDLLKCYPLEKITISQIARQCHINRKTCYLYISEPTDILRNYLTQKIITEIEDTINHCQIHEGPVTFDIRNRAMRQHVLEVLSANQSSLITVYQQLGPDFELFNLLISYFKKHWAPFNLIRHDDYGANFIVDQQLHFLGQSTVSWLMSDPLLPVHEAAYLSELLISTSISDTSFLTTHWHDNISKKQ
jgi:AcrR family transcriptional regulator